MTLLLLMVGLLLAVCLAMCLLLELWFRDLENRALETAREELRRFAEAHDGEFRSGRDAAAAGSAAVEIEGCACRAAYHLRWVESPRTSQASKGLLVTKSICADLRDLWTERLDPERFVAAMQRGWLQDARATDTLAQYSRPPRVEIPVMASGGGRLACRVTLPASDRPLRRWARARDDVRPSPETLSRLGRGAPASARRRRLARRHRSFDVQATSRGLRFRAGPRMPLDELAATAARYLQLYARAVDEANRPEPIVYR